MKRVPKKIAVLDLVEGREWSFLALHERVLEASKELVGIKPGTRIAFADSNGSQWIVSFLAIQSVGGIAIALEKNLEASVQLRMARELRANFFWENAELKRVGGGLIRKSAVAFEKLTSGSTGQPKRIPWSHRHLIIDGFQIASTMGIRSHDFQLGLIPLGHSYGMGSLVMPLLLQGTSLALAPDFVPAQILGWIQKWNLTFFPTVPAVLKALVLSASVSSLYSLRKVVSAGARLEPELARQFLNKFGMKVCNFYGSTETGGIAYDRTGGATLSGRSLGKPLKGVRIRCDRNSRIIVQSGAVATRTGEFRMQDCGRWNERGEIVLIGRIRPVVNVGGKKIDLGEMERLFLGISGVQEVWVGIEESRGRQHFIAAMETAFSVSEMMKKLKQLIPAWQTPKRIYTDLCLPRNERGKLDSKKIQSCFERI